MDLFVRAVHGPSTSPIEIVERKGLGHPDTICDAIAERVCIALCRAYMDRFGVILHHNVDKVLLVGGTSRTAFGSGEIVDPIEIYVAGRVTAEHRGVRIRPDAIAVDACRAWIRENLRYVDPDRDVKIIPRFRTGSAELRDLVGRAVANDTSAGVGFAPPTPLEKAVLAVETTLNDPETKRSSPEIGEDVKVMGVRRGDGITLTIGCAFVARHVRDAADYAEKKARVAALAAVRARAVSGLDVETFVNLADDVERGIVYLTASGTSAEAGDDGEVGRGNRVGGLITPNRPMTLEAAAGKNPRSHVGKLYSVLARRIAESIAASAPGVLDAQCALVSQIGRPVDDPHIADVLVRLEEPREDLRAPVDAIVRRELSAIDAIRDDLLAQRVRLF